MPRRTGSSAFAEDDGRGETTAFIGRHFPLVVDSADSSIFPDTGCPAMLYDLAALAAAVSIAFSNLIAPQAIRHLGPVVFNCWRLAAALLALLGLIAVRGGWSWPSSGELLALAASSMLGI